ncbi:MAG: hypothetical protein ACTTH0_01480 [Eubacteriales bacterium]
MKRNVFLPESADFSKTQVDKDAESINYEARIKLSNLRSEVKKDDLLKVSPEAKPKLKPKKQEKSKSYADILKEMQRNKK